MKSIRLSHASTLFHGDEQSRKLVISKLNQGVRAGTTLTVNATSIMKSGGAVHVGTESVADPRFLRIYFTQAYGGLYNKQNLAIAADRLYNAILGGSYTTTSFSKTDLLKFLIIQANFFAELAMGDRGLAAYNAVKYENMSVELAESATGFQMPSSATNDYADIIALRNRIANTLNQLIMPANIPALDRLISLCQHIYADDVHEKTQMFVLIPTGFYDTLNGTGNDVSFIPFTPGVYLYNYYEQLYFRLQSFIADAFYKEIAPYLYKAFASPQKWLDSPLYQVDVTYDPLLKDLDVVYDIELVQLLRNGEYVGDLLNSQFGMKLWENANEELEQGYLSFASDPYQVDFPGLAVRPVAATVSLTSGFGAYDIKNATTADVAYVGQFEDRVVNGEDFPTSEDSLYVILASSMQFKNVSSSYDKRINNITYCGHIILNHVQIIYGNGTPSSKFIPYYITANGALYYAPDGLANLTNIANLKKFSVAPIIRNVNIDFVNTAVTNNTSFISDVDNLIEVPLSALTRYTEFNIFNLFCLSNVTVQKSNGNTVPNKTNKRRHKSKDKRKPSDDKTTDKTVDKPAQ